MRWTDDAGRGRTSRGRRGALPAVALIAAVLLTACSGAGRTGGAPGPSLEDPVVPTASPLTSEQPTPAPMVTAGPTTSNTAGPTSRRTTTTGPPPPRTTTQARPNPPPPVGPPAVAPRVVPPPPPPAPPPPPPVTSRKPSPVTRPGGAPQGAAVIELVDSGADYTKFKAAQLKECKPEGRPKCWTFVLVGKASDRVCAVSPPPHAFVEYGKTITITTKPVPADMTCFDYEAAQTGSGD